RKKGWELREAAWPFLALPEYAPRLRRIFALVPPPLPYAQAELQSVADLWTAPADLFYGDEATLDALAKALPGAHYAHFACHGSFDPENPAASALHLAGGDRLALRDLNTPRWEEALRGLRLAVLSACQTAIVDFRDLPEEAFGLPAGFLAAGVLAVVGSLWPVNDRSTALLMHRLYELHLQGDPEEGIPPLPPRLALREAQRWLRTVTNRDLKAYLERYRRFKAASAGANRMSLVLIREERRRTRRGKPDERPYASPYHWAGFVFYGR
ncbi:MAG TPA: CHAT domain-containing protein, partial [Chloroflexi bacterium]|nr:CHAT domain-containing protein [Chloroflexota bacterium]